jgi:hypothetical protein
MLDIFNNEVLNKHANDYFLMFFNMKDDEIDTDGYRSAFLEIFPLHLINAEMKKCKKIYKEIYSWIVDDFLHRDFRPIHEYVLYSMLQIQADLEKENDIDYTSGKKAKDELEGKNLSEDDIYNLENINNALFYMDHLFEDNDFMQYKQFYDTFGTEGFYQMGYDNRIIELLPKDKRKELKEKLKNNERPYFV